jgi:uncharacterized RDD family membrane protein YckC
LVTATTFGKSMVGARVSTLSGARPSAAQLLLRAVFKVVVLLIPPLVLVAIGNRHSQGIDDFAAATLVVRDAPVDDRHTKQ